MRHITICVSSAFLFAAPSIAEAAENACAVVTSAPLLAAGVLNNPNHQNNGAIWVDQLRGGNNCSSNGKSMDCSMTDPGLVRVNVSGKDFIFAVPVGKAVKIAVANGATPTCITTKS